MEILIVDGGTTQAPVIARANPDAKVTATVHSKESMDHAIYLKHKNLLGNLELRLLPIDEVTELNQTFDLVIASGVLQEAGYAEAQLGMKALAQVLRPEGVAAFLLYSRYLPSNPDAGYQPKTADSFLHSRGVNFSVQDCLDLVEGAGLVFQDWIVKSPYHMPASVGLDNEVLAVIRKLPDWQMWSVMEPLRNQIGCHIFMTCSRDRPEGSYRINFADPRALDYVPAWQGNAGLAGRHAVRPGWSVPLDSVHRTVAEGIDGRRSIRAIAGNRAIEDLAITLCKELWRLDFLTISMPTPQN